MAIDCFVRKLYVYFQLVTVLITARTVSMTAIARHQTAVQQSMVYAAQGRATQIMEELLAK
jgi:hypothetical protein